MSTFGHTFRISTWGESHGLTVGCVVDGVPPGLELTEEDVQPQLDRRRPGQSTLTTARSEADQVTIMSGTENGITLGTPVAMMVKNKDQRKFDYANTTLIPRPGHADYTYQVKYGIKASSGGGRASARETIGRVAAGAVAEKYLSREFGCKVVAWVDSIMEIRLPEDVRDGFKSKPPTREEEVDEFGIIRQAKLGDDDEKIYLIDHLGGIYDGTTGHPIPQGVAVDDLTVTNTHYIRCPHGPTAAQMVARLLQVKAANDSCGGTISCCITDCPFGLGEPCMDKFEAELAKGIMSLPATKGFEIGSGFDGARTLRGSRNNDPFESGVDVDGLLHTATNNHGGTLGGITSGMPIYFRVCIKAASSIGMEQVTADFDGHTQTLAVKGRHDPCVLPRAPPLVESMAAIVTMDMLLRQRSRGRPIHTLRVNPFQWLLLVIMANITDKGVAGAHGGNPQFLISQIVRDRVYSLRYWKEECFGLNAETILDKAAELKYVGTVYGPLQRPSPFLCLLVKLLQIGPEKEIIKSFIDLSAGDDAGELRYLRALACTYLRYIGRPEEIYNWLEPVLWDYRQIVVRKLDGSFEISNLDTWINTLLTEDEIITLGLPKLPQRHILEEREALKPFDWPPEVVEGLKEEPADEPIEVDGDDKAHSEGEAEDGGAEGSRRKDDVDRSRSKSTDGERKHRHHHHHRHGEKKKKKGADAEEQQEIDEANALRAKLGLKPLRT